MHRPIPLRALKAEPWEYDLENRLAGRIQRVLRPMINRLIDQEQDGLLDVSPGLAASGIEGDLAEAIYDANLEAGFGAVSRMSEQIGMDIGQFSPRVDEKLRNQAFIASQATLDRVDDTIMETISSGYRDGLGIDDIKENLHRKYDGFLGYETERIARTEVNSAQNMVAYETQRDLGVDYHQWWGELDGRIRDSHEWCHEAITAVDGGKFPNGLSYPGDRSGPIEEWINCRCRDVPYLMPEGYRAPDSEYFWPDDLIEIKVGEENKAPKPDEPEGETVTEDQLVNTDGKLSNSQTLHKQDELIEQAGEHSRRPWDIPTDSAEAAREFGLDNRALIEYKSAAYGPINRALRGAPTKLDERLQESVQNNIQRLDNVFEQLPPTKQTRVFRGLEHPELSAAANANRNVVGKQLRDPAYMSTSINPGVADEFARSQPDISVVLDIDVPNNTAKSTYVDAIDDMGESELLFERGTVLEIVSQGFTELATGDRVPYLRAIVRGVEK